MKDDSISSRIKRRVEPFEACCIGSSGIQYFGLLGDIESTGCHVGRSDRFDLGHVGELALIEQLSTWSSSSWPVVAESCVAIGWT